MKVYNSSKNNLIADDVKIAKTFIKRTFGLIPKSSILKDEGLVIYPCFSVHTFFMKFAIDILFINKQNKVIALYQNVKPYRILPIHPNSHYVIELAADVISTKNIEKDDFITLE